MFKLKCIYAIDNAYVNALLMVVAFGHQAVEIAQEIIFGSGDTGRGPEQAQPYRGDL
jgi:hypothetical protein